MKQWFVATTKHQQEAFSAGQLRDQAYPVYLPKQYRHPTDDGYGQAPYALRFPGYIFIRFDAAAEEHGPISNTRGVDELLVTRGGVPLSLPDRIIEDLQALEDEEFARGRARSKPVPRDDLVPGEVVIICKAGHPVQGERGQFLGSDKGEARVLIGMMAWPVPEFELKKVEPKKQKKAA